MKKLLFVSHDASRTGAPILLINLARILKEIGYDIEFLLKKSGPLEKDFKDIGTTYLAEREHKKGLLRKIKNRLKKKSSPLGLLPWSSYCLVISNTLTNGDILKEIKKNYTGKIITYAHELEIATHFYTNHEDLKRTLDISNEYWVPSYGVKKHLINNLGIAAQNIKLLHYYIPAFSKSGTTIIEREFTVGAAGTSDWRKAPEIFIQSAYRLFQKYPEAKMKFIWQGAQQSGIEISRIRYEIKKAGLEEKVIFLPSTSKMGEFYSNIDVFFLSSKEDPYPLVVLEAANARVPTICMEDAGGSPEFIQASKGGRVVPFLDIESIVDAIWFYYQNESLRKNDGECAYRHLANTHQNEDYIAKQFRNILN